MTLAPYRQRLAQPPVTGDLDIITHAFRAAFGTAEGQIALDYIVQKLCGVDSPAFPIQYVLAGHSASDVLAYNLARRDVGLEIYHLASGQYRDQKPEVKT